ATGWLIGEKHGGMAAMFTMMNNARLGVGTQGVAVAEAAFQHALAYAQDRKQGKAAGTGAIIEHADVRRMLSTMKADTYAARGISMMNAVAIDMAVATRDPVWKARAAFLTPIGKVFGSDMGCEVSAMGIQVHGGMGFIEDTGAAQFARDARVTTIYEGTNGIQAMDLTARKLMDGGDAAFRILEEIQVGADAAKAKHPDLAEAVWQSVETLRETTEWLVAQKDLNNRFAGAVPYLRAFARVLGGHVHLASAVSGNASRVRLATFYIKRILPEHTCLLAHTREGAADLMAISADDLAA
ncbi:MAG: acyl-CoA dehydrogenase, partial [Yoonia sp.]